MPSSLAGSPLSGTFSADMALEPLPTGPLLIASDAAPASDAAFPFARALQLAHGGAVHVVSVMPSVLAPMYGLDAVTLSPDIDASIRAARHTALLDQQQRLLGTQPGWTLSERTGEAAPQIVAAAVEHGARLILAGRGQHALIDRLFTGETVTRLLQLGDTPVLAVAPTLTALPRRLIIATDFSRFSLYAARVALSIADPNATVFLMHVRPYHDRTLAALADPQMSESAEISRAFADALRHLTRPGLTIDTVVREGNPHHRLIEFANNSQADLVACATHGYGFFRRAILGSVAATLIRTAPCSVLSVPGHAQTVAAARSGMLAEEDV
jgi:nucleotide-binding universal stress UspA family protein